LSMAARGRGLVGRFLHRTEKKPTRDYSHIVDADLLSKLDRLSLALGRDLISGLMGEHAAQRRTSGIEFADFRQYSAGDDLRRVDWNAYARLGTLQIRQAQAEHDTMLYLLVDSSPSMSTGDPPKFYTGRRLAAALGYVALAFLDNVVLAAPGAENSGIVEANIVRGRSEAGQLFRSLQNLRTGTIAPFDNLLAQWSTGRGQGRVAVVISDLLLDGYRDGVRQLVGAGFAVTVLHILSPQELDPEGQGEIELIDSETGERLEVHLGQASLAEYRRRLEVWRSECEEWCRNQGANYFLIRSDWEADRILLSTLRRGGVTE
jgi:uncharacterized protein (DUF58 family)